MISVDLIVRSDALAKGGGDMVQVAKYVEELAPDEFDMKVVPFHPTMKLRQGAVAHIVNVDRPFDFVLACQLARTEGHPLVVSPIHHDLEAVRRMRAAETGLGLRSILGRFLPESGREWIATVVRSLKMRSGSADGLAILRIMLSQVRHIRCIWTEAGRALDQAHAVLLLAPGEGHSLMRDTGWSGTNSALVPNGSPSKMSIANRRAWSDRDIDLIVVGRVEPRKRTLELARIAARSGLRLTIVGPLHAAHSPFGEEFREVVSRSSSITWNGALSADEVLELLGRSKVLVNASWVEVQSLVELEAAHSGCYVVSSGTGNTSDWLTGGVVSTGDDNVSALLDKANQLLALGVAPPAVAYPHSWQSVSQQVGDAYRSAVGTGAT